METPRIRDLTSALQATLGGEYVVERELGGGGMSRVFLATETALRRRIVVKVLPPELVARLSAERFRREIEFAASLQHSYIVPVLTARASGELLYFTMPYVSGESLRHRLAERGPLPVVEAVRIAAEAAEAVGFAHRRGIVHRDIKPGNILLAEDGHAAVTDFGVARALSRAASPDGDGDALLTITEHGQLVGTPQYMSPEQAAGRPDVDARSDIYSLGCVLYEMLTGAPPFPGASAGLVLEQQLTTSPRPLRAARPDAPAALERALARALAKDPARRWPDARELADALLQSVGALGSPASGSEAVRPAPDGWLGRVRPPRARFVVALAVVAAAAVATWLHARDEGGPPPEQLVAVAPFAILSGDSALQRWKYDIPTLLAPRLDDAQPLRAVSLAAGVGERREVRDRDDATEQGRRVQARYVVLGRVLPDPRFAVRVEAEVLDVPRGEVLEVLEVRGHGPRADPEQTLLDVTDSLTHALLASFNASVPVAATRNAAFGCRTSSRPAIAHYLRGEQFYRRTQWDSAIAAYRAAIALDAGCALAYRRIAIAVGWQEGDDAREALRHKLLAGAHNHGLPPRDSLLVTADSLEAAVNELYAAPDVPATVYWAHVRRLFDTLAEAAERYPGDAEVWYAIGDARYHWGWGPAATTPEAIADAFDRAIRQDSGFALSYLHSIELAFARGGPAAARPYVDGYLATRPTDVNADGVRLVAALADPRTAGAPATARRLGTESVDAVVAARNLLDRWNDPAETAVRLSRVIAARAGVDTVRIARCAAGGTPGGRPAPELARRLAYRGHARAAACALADSTGSGTARWTFAELALLHAGALPDSLVDARLTAWGRADESRANYALPWWAARGDSASLDAFLERAAAGVRAPDPVRRERAEYDTAAARAWRVLLHGDSGEALRRFRALPRTHCRGGCFDPDRLEEARLLAAAELHDDARAILAEWRGAYAVPSDVVAAYERGRAAEARGDAADAAAAYRTVAAAWARADAPLQRYVRDARAALGRLGAVP